MRVEDRAAVDRNDVVRVGLGETDSENIVRSHARMQRDATTPKAVGIDQGRHVAFDPGVCQRGDHDLALPGAIAFRVPVLDGAAAADAEMRAERRDTFGACAFDLDQAPAVGMAGHRRDLDGLATERVGHIDAHPGGGGDAIAAMADMIDDDFLVLSHGAHRGRIRHCRRRR